MKTAYIALLCAVAILATGASTIFTAEAPSEQQQAAIDALTVVQTELKAELARRPDMGYIYVDENYRTMVPLRLLAETMDLEVTWDQARQTAAILGGVRGQAVFTIGSQQYIVGGEVCTMDTVPVVFAPGRIHLPLRFVAEAVGATLQTDEENGFRIFVSAVIDTELIAKAERAKVERLATFDSEVLSYATGALFMRQQGHEVYLLFAEAGKILRIDLETKAAVEISLSDCRYIKSYSYQSESELLLLCAYTETDEWVLMACRLDGSEVWRRLEADVWSISTCVGGWVYTTDTAVVRIDETGEETAPRFPLPPHSEAMMASHSTEETLTISAFSLEPGEASDGRRLIFDWSGTLMATQRAVLWGPVVELSFGGGDEAYLMGSTDIYSLTNTSEFEIYGTDADGSDVKIKTIQLPESYRQNHNVLTGSMEANRACYVFGVTYQKGVIVGQFLIVIDHQLAATNMYEFELGEGRAVIYARLDAEGQGITLVTTRYGDLAGKVAPELWQLELA